MPRLGIYTTYSAVNPRCPVVTLLSEKKSGLSDPRICRPYFLTISCIAYLHSKALFEADRKIIDHILLTLLPYRLRCDLTLLNAMLQCLPIQTYQLEANTLSKDYCFRSSYFIMMQRCVVVFYSISPPAGPFVTLPLVWHPNRILNI